MDIQHNMRQCKVCGDTLPYSDDKAHSYYFVVKRRPGKIYFSHVCKTCTLQTRRQYMKKYHTVNYVKKKNNPIDHSDQVNNISNN